MVVDSIADVSIVIDDGNRTHLTYTTSAPTIRTSSNRDREGSDSAVREDSAGSSRPFHEAAESVIVNVISSQPLLDPAVLSKTRNTV